MGSLTAVQKRVLAEITWNCRDSVADVAKRLRLRDHTVRYAIDQLNSLLDLKAICFTNPFRMGVLPFRIYFCVNSSDKAKVNKMVEYLRKLPEMYWLYGLYGYYQFGMSIRVPNMQVLNTILTKFDDEFGDLITRKSISVLARFAYYEPWIAHTGTGSRKSFEYVNDNERVPFDSVDEKILNAVRSQASLPVGGIAKIVGLPASTVSYRLEKMQKTGVVMGFAYAYESRIDGTESFLIQIAVKGLGFGVVERLFKFARNHPQVEWASRTIGEWDVEMEVGLTSAFELDEIIHQIYKCGEGRVREVMTHAWGREFNTGGREDSAGHERG